MSTYDDDAERLGDECDMCGEPVLECRCDERCPTCHRHLMECPCDPSTFETQGDDQ